MLDLAATKGKNLEDLIFNFVRGLAALLDLEVYSVYEVDKNDLVI